MQNKSKLSQELMFVRSDTSIYINTHINKKFLYARAVLEKSSNVKNIAVGGPFHVQMKLLQIPKAEFHVSKSRISYSSCQALKNNETI